MEEPEQDNISEWKRPDQVMQLHRLKLKKRALQARMNRSSTNKSNNEQSLQVQSPSSNDNSAQSIKRKNPFAKSSVSKKQKEVESPDLDVSTDNTLFELLNLKVPESKKVIDSPLDRSLTFASVLSKLETPTNSLEVEIPKGEKYIPIDWTINTKIRFMSRESFPWNDKLKPSGEASGTTAFVRCLDIGEKDTTLDTSPNARFHRCCLVWQHPSLPWLELFPRSAGKVSASLASNAAIGNNQFIKDALYHDWCESFRSLYYLLRARQCPYFYVCANTFTVLFRAAGICGISEAHALLTPTTRGLRQLLKQEDIQYTMPLRKDHKRRSDTADSGCETLDSCTSNMTVIGQDDDQNENNVENEENEEDDEDHEEWLQSLGVENSEIRKINSIQTRKKLEKESEVDNMKQSLIFVQGVEAQSLFNFLINCKSATATTGALAGVPPTILAPTAFHGATLKPLKVRGSTVRVDNDKFYSLEIKGPILPHVLPSLCDLMKSSNVQQYSASCAHLATTTAFSPAKHGLEQSESTVKNSTPQSVFGQENLSDCGFSEDLLRHFCHSDPERIQVLESFKFSNELFSWT